VQVSFFSPFQSAQPRAFEGLLLLLQVKPNRWQVLFFVSQAFELFAPFESFL